MKDTCKQTSQHRRAPRVELIYTGRDQPKLRIRIFQQVSLFSVVKGGVALATATVGCSKDVLVLDGASNVGNVAVGCIETSVVVESPSVDPSNAPPPVGTVAAVGVGTALPDRMFNLQGQVVVPPRSYAAVTKVVVLLVVEFFITSTWVTMP